MPQPTPARTPSTAPVPPHIARCELLTSIYETALRLGVSPEVAAMICAETHTEWAGEQAYFPRDDSDAVRQRTDRDQLIRRLAQRGESYTVIARAVQQRFGSRITRQRISQIVSSRVF